MRPALTLEICVLLLVTALALALRTVALDSFPPSPDDGSYLFSAGVQGLGLDDGPSWLAEDLAWVTQPKAYPHSYLHQWVMRWIHRAGADNLTTVRLDSAVLGALTPLVLYLFLAGVFPERRATALIAAASLAFLVMHCWYSRTGWGQPGCTFFWTLYLWLGYRLFHDGEQRAARHKILLGFGLASVALAAYGYHEMVVVHVLGLGLYGALQWFWERRNPHPSRRRWAVLVFVISCVPVGAYAAMLPREKFASMHWFGLVPDGYGLGYWSYRWRVIETFVQNRLDLQVGWIVLLLGLAGAVGMHRRDPRAFRFFATIFVTSWAIFFFFFRDPYLVRIYLPTFVVLVIFASEGLAILHTHLRRYGSALAHAAVGLILLFFLVQSTQTVLGESGARFAARNFYAGSQGEPNRHHLAPIVDHLREHMRTGDAVGVTDIYTPYFELEDQGIRSLLLLGRRRKPEDGRPQWMIGRIKDVEGGELKDVGGRKYYEHVVSDTLGSLGLFRRR